MRGKIQEVLKPHDNTRMICETRLTRRTKQFLWHESMLTSNLLQYSLDQEIGDPLPR
jgi:hypothetical protein